MKIRSVIKASVVSLVAGSVLLTQLYAADMATDSVVKTESGYHHGNKDQDHEGCMQNKHRGHEGGMHKMLRKLDLTDAQKVKVKAIFDKDKANRPERPTKEQRAEHRAEMLALITGASFDEAKATEMAQAQQQKHLQGMLTHFKIQNEIYQVLTPEQQQIFQQKFNPGKGHQPRR